MVPGLVTVFLLNIVAVWNNYFLPLIIFTRSSAYPLTVGLALLAQGAGTGSKGGLVPVLIAGGLVTVIPVILLFVLLQRYFRADLLTEGAPPDEAAKPRQASPDEQPGQQPRQAKPRKA